MKKEIGQIVDWNEGDKDRYLSAMIISPVNDLPIKELLKAALTNKIDDLETFFKGIVPAIIMKDILNSKQRICNQ
ncbi:hypothetical protein [Enterococcus canis]|uniref:hypothetical protein n=1 Tax=Enterococcus canis TaxID=214095 RepID=UPI000A9471F9|nr:hypothetical protein [Enterococcus canis]